MYTNKLCKLLLLIIFYLIPLQGIRADFWTDVGDFFCDGKEFTEFWDGKSTTKDYLSICPPYYKLKGRDGCLKKFDLPKGGYYMEYCAQESVGSNYFSPKIQIKLQKCWFGTCRTQTIDLASIGECKIVTGAYLLPTYRFCARVANGPRPKDDIKKLDEIGADHGYTAKVHLDFEGAEKQDPDYLKILDEKGNQTDQFYAVPKICAYEDPWIIGMGLDLMDKNPTSQPIHKNSGQVAGFITFLLVLQSLGKEITEGLLVDWWAPNSKDGKEDTAAATIAKFIKWLLDLFGKPFIFILKEIGDLNRVVNSSLGCVNMPVGPLPPPYFRKFDDKSGIFNLVVQQICPKVQNITDESTKKLALEILQEMMSTKGCVTSELDNNFIRNSVRVGINKIIPTCDTLKSINPSLYAQIVKDEKLKDTDQCVQLSNLIPEQIELFNFTKFNHIAPCKPNSKDPCFSETTNLNTLCSIYNGCNRGRVVYGDRFENGRMATTPNPNLNTQLDDPQSKTDNKKYRRPICASDSDINCQAIWGINIGGFEDIFVEFDKLNFQTQEKISSKIKTIKVNDKLSLKFNATINLDPKNVRTDPDDTEKSTTVGPDKICVMDTDKNYAINCITRTKPLNPKIYNCDEAKKDGLSSCNSTFFRPQMYVKFEYDNGEDDKYTTAGIIEADVLKSKQDINNYTDNKFKLAGYSYGSYVTDDQDRMVPFSGPHSLNMGTSIYGNYANDANPLTDKDAIYLNGLEYLNGRYVRGGTKICLTSPEKENCPVDKGQCILVQYKNGENIPCDKLKVYLEGKHLCTDTTKDGCKSIGKKTFGDKEIETFNCTKNLDCYQYKNGATLGTEELCMIKYPDRKILRENFDPYNLTDLPKECAIEQEATNEITIASNIYKDKNFRECTDNDPSKPVCEELFPDKDTIKDLDDKNFEFIALKTCTTSSEGKAKNSFVCFTRLTKLDQNKCAVDTKSGRENGLCTDIDSIGCDDITQASAESAFSTWSKANSGDFSTGTCQEGFVPISDTSLKRRCVAKFDPFNLNSLAPTLNKGQLEPIGKKFGCKQKESECKDVKLDLFPSFLGATSTLLEIKTIPGEEKCQKITEATFKTRGDGPLSFVEILLRADNPSALGDISFKISSLRAQTLITCSLATKGRLLHSFDIDGTKEPEWHNATAVMDFVKFSDFAKGSDLEIILQYLNPADEITVSVKYTSK
ncbi:MAG: hypothetical protein K9G11_00210 [Rickettsiaceae bacterium]|nr:hypothetical protein [Rickettsiaceae bacterium]